MALSVSFAVNSGHVPMTLSVAGSDHPLSEAYLNRLRRFPTSDLKDLARLGPNPFAVDVAFSNEQRLVFQLKPRVKLGILIQSNSKPSP